MFAVDLDPEDDPGVPDELTGFNPMDPEGGPTVPGYYEGYSGTQYYGTLEMNVTLADLPNHLLGYDLSKFVGDPSSRVHILQATVPASDFVPQPFEFNFEYLGYVESGDPSWVGAVNPDYPYQHSWKLDITYWNCSVAKIDDIDIEGPTITPGYIEVVPPSNWVIEPVIIGRYGYEANPGDEFTNVGQYTDWRVNGKTPYVVPGYVYLTDEDERKSTIKSTLIVGDQPGCGDWGYLDSDLNLDCYTNLADFAQVAAEWLECTEPSETGCVSDTVVGLGFAFYPEDTTGPATIIEMYDDTYASQLEPNDIIVEYRGIPISCGANLQTVIDGLPELVSTEIVPLELVRDGLPVSVDLPAIELSVKKFRPPSGNNMDCKEVPYTPSGHGCQCVTGTHICACGREIKRDKQTKKVIKYRWVCADSGGGERCVGDWIHVK